jgi:hypothetical protein
MKSKLENRAGDFEDDDEAAIYARAEDENSSEKPKEPEKPEEPPKTSPKAGNFKKGVTLVLTGAGSFSGRGVKEVRKGLPFETDFQTAEKLLATGLFEKRE